MSTPADLPVAAPDPARYQIGVLIGPCSEAEAEALVESIADRTEEDELSRAALLVERQQDKERIERLEKTRKAAVDRLLSDPGQAAIAAVDGLRKILPQLKIEEDEQIRLILNWIGVAGDDNLSLAERVRFLALELATRQGYTFEEADRLAPPAFPAALAVEEDANG